MRDAWTPFWTGTILAIATTTGMDASGYTHFSALPLAVWMVLLWSWQRYGRREIGFTLGKGRHYLQAISYPLLVIGTLHLCALAMGVTNTSEANWETARLNLVAGLIGTFLVSMITEEGFFRGALWASARRAGASPRTVLLLTSLVFTAWHVSWVTLDTGGDLPGRQIPVYLVNATLMGLVWGMLREVSGSIVVASLCHGVWNGLAYSLFGFGEKTGALGIEESWVWSPETGLLGTALSLAFATVYYLKVYTPSVDQR